MAGILNRISTVLFAFLTTKAILNRLLQKCTTPVKAMAKSTGKNRAKTGIKIVPNPNPEKKISREVAKAAKAIITISINSN